VIDLANLLVFLLALALSLALVPVARAFGRRFGFMDAVHPDKIHHEPMVRCGGAGIAAAFCITLLGGLALLHFQAPRSVLPPSLADHIPNIPSVLPRLAIVMAGALLLFVVGLVDDKANLRPIVKLAFQILAGLILVAGGITIQMFIPGWLPGAVLTVIWVVLISNAFNLLDNMNGLTAGVSLVCALSFYLVSRAGGEYFMMAMFAALAGSVAGFLPYNFPRARLFMGDSGSLFIGFLFAALSIMVTYYDAGVPSQLPVVAPLIVLGVPLFDTLSVMWIRWRAGKPLMQGDQNHFSHRLVALGFSRVGAVMFIWTVTLCVGLAAVNLRYLAGFGAIIALGQIVLFFLLIFWLEMQGKKAAGQIK
jgi:UDP-GlcNAc:undecaprenyl-phosphate GlcNAc-1-phosphate transferase